MVKKGLFNIMGVMRCNNPPLFDDFVGIKKPIFLDNRGKVTARLPTDRIYYLLRQ